MKELIEIQKELKVLKNNSGGKFKYRTCEEIFQEVKPLCVDRGVLLTVTDEMLNLGDRYYIKATATVEKDGVSKSASAIAREPDSIMAMALPQISGTCSSYARKGAMGGLFAIDNNPDVDSGKDVAGEKSKDIELASPDQLKLLKKCVDMLETNGLTEKSDLLSSKINTKTTVASFNTLYGKACEYLGEKVTL